MEGDWIDVAGGRGGLINPLQVRPAPRDEDDNANDGIGDLYKLISNKCVTDKNNAAFYEDLKTYLESAANGADHGLWNGYTTINPQSSFVVLDTKSLVQMSGAVLAAQYFNILSWCRKQITRDPAERIPKGLRFSVPVSKRAVLKRHNNAVC